MRTFNVLATYRDPRDADEAARQVTAAGVDAGDLRVRPAGGPDGDERSALRGEMAEEADSLFAGPSVVMPGTHAEGAWTATAVSAVVGGLLGLLGGLVWAFAVSSPLSVGFRIGIPTLSMAVAGATVGFIIGGAWWARHRMSTDEEYPLDDARMGAERNTILAVHADDADVIDTALGVLRQTNPVRVDLVDADGNPLPPQQGNPRPADPPGRWWDPKATG